MHPKVQFVGPPGIEPIPIAIGTTDYESVALYLTNKFSPISGYCFRFCKYLVLFIFLM